MIATQNIQAYINFLHFKKYLLPATEVLLAKWASLSDTEIRENLNGLYRHWGFNTDTARAYEAEFLAMQQKIEAAPVAAPSQVIPTPVVPPQTAPVAIQPLEDSIVKNSDDRSGSALWYIIIGVIVLLVAGAGIWWYYRQQPSAAAQDQDKQLLQKVEQANLAADRERRLRAQKDSLELQQTLEKERKINDFKANQGKYIQHKINYDYDGTFGGIKNVSVTVSNQSGFKMNEVTVQLQYIKKNGDLYETKKVSVYNIPAQQSRTITAPGSKRGTKMQSRITAIQSDETELPAR